VITSYTKSVITIMFELTFSLNASLMHRTVCLAKSSISTLQSNCQIGRFIGVFEVFLSIVYFKWATFNSVLLSCSLIVISILTFLHELFELIKMMMICNEDVLSV